MPTLHLHAHYHDPGVHLQKWREMGEKALPLCLEGRKHDHAALIALDEVEITFISDEAIAAVHAEFLDDPTPTDVITFHHGEILISLDTAAAQAKEHQHDYEREVALYIIHGLLHLAGWNDIDAEERKQMHELQNAILNQVW